MRTAAAIVPSHSVSEASVELQSSFSSSVYGPERSLCKDRHVSSSCELTVLPIDIIGVYVLLLALCSLFLVLVVDVVRHLAYQPLEACRRMVRNKAVAPYLRRNQHRRRAGHRLQSKQSHLRMQAVSTVNGP